MPQPTPDVLVQLDALDADAANLFSLPAERLIHAPGAGHWSALQCFEHLTLMNRVYIDYLDQVIREATARGEHSTGPFTYPWTAHVVLWLLEPPPKVKVPVPTRQVAPPQTTDVDAVRNAYAAQHADLRRVIGDAMTVNLRTTLRHPFVRGVRMQLGSILGAILAHERRHIYQAKKAAGVFVV